MENYTLPNWYPSTTEMYFLEAFFRLLTPLICISTFAGSEHWKLELLFWTIYSPSIFYMPICAERRKWPTWCHATKTFLLVLADSVTYVHLSQYQ